MTNEGFFTKKREQNKRPEISAITAINRAKTLGIPGFPDKKTIIEIISNGLPPEVVISDLFAANYPAVLSLALIDQDTYMHHTKNLIMPYAKIASRYVCAAKE